MRKIFEKLGNVPTILVLGIITAGGMAFYDVVQGLEGIYDYLAVDISLIIIYLAMTIFACTKNKVATLGIFTIGLGAYILGSLQDAVLIPQFADECFKAGENGSGVAYIFYALTNGFFVISAVLFVVAKYFLKGKKTTIINIMLVCFTLTVVASIGAFITTIALDTNIFSGLSNISYLMYGLSQVTGPLLFIACGALTESVNK